MKLIFVLSAVAQAEKSWFTKEWQVIGAYEEGEEIVLQNPFVRSNVQWHDCGDKPPTPVNARDVRCRGTTCASVCKKGYRSAGAWKSRCQPNGSWTRETLTDCITCNETPAVDPMVNIQKIHVKNLAVRQFFCAQQSNTLNFGNQTTIGSTKKNVKCLCRRQSPWKWTKECNWYHKNKIFSDTDFASISCTP